MLWPGPKQRASKSSAGAGIKHLTLAAFDRAAFGAPAQHPAGQIGHLFEPGLREGSVACAERPPGTADRNDRLSLVDFSARCGELAQRNQLGARELAKRSTELLRLTDVEDLDAGQMFLEPGRLNLPNARKSIVERRPIRLTGLHRWIGLPAFEIGRNGDVDLVSGCARCRFSI